MDTRNIANTLDGLSSETRLFALYLAVGGAGAFLAGLTWQLAG